MTHKEVYEWAVKGIRAEVEKLDNDIRKGLRLLEQYEKGEQPKTPKSASEIWAIIQRKREEIEELDKKRIELQFDMEEL